MTPVNIENRKQRCYVYTINEDGNCLFAALIHQIFQKNLNTNQHTSLTRQLRTTVVQYIREHLNERKYQDLIDIRMHEHFPQMSNISRQHYRQQMLDTLSRNRIWGGTEIITAVSEIFKCTIITGRYTSRIKAHTAPTNRTIRLVYRQTNGTWNHYDSFAHFADDDSPARYTTEINLTDRSNVETIEIDSDINPSSEPTKRKRKFPTEHLLPNQPTNDTSSSPDIDDVNTIPIYTHVANEDDSSSARIPDDTSDKVQRNAQIGDTRLTVPIIFIYFHSFQ